jgi:hypothetical protein
MPIELIRFAKGYENSIVSAEVDASGRHEIYGYQNMCLHFKDGKFFKHEWKYFVELYSPK